MKDAATCRYRESTPIAIYTTCESSFNNDHQRGSSEHLPEEIQPSPKRQCCCRLNVMCKIRCIHSNGSNHDKKSGSSYRLIPLSFCRKFSRAQYTTPILCRAKQKVEFMYTLGVVHYILNDVLHSPGVYINGYSISICPLRALEYRGAWECYTGNADWSLTSDLKFYNGCLKAFLYWEKYS